MLPGIMEKSNNFFSEKIDGMGTTKISRRYLAEDKPNFLYAELPNYTLYYKVSIGKKYTILSLAKIAESPTGSLPKSSSA